MEPEAANFEWKYLLMQLADYETASVDAERVSRDAQTRVISLC
jgi:hypothetical protein